MDVLTEFTSISIRIHVSLGYLFVCDILSSIYYNQRQSLSTLVPYKSVPIRVRAKKNQCLSDSVTINVRAGQSRHRQMSAMVKISIGRSALVNAKVSTG